MAPHRKGPGWKKKGCFKSLLDVPENSLVAYIYIYINIYIYI